MVRGRRFLVPQDIRDVAPEVLRHRLLLTYDALAAGVRVRREAALRALEFFAAFEPRLVGPVLDGTADANAPVALQLYTDDADAVPRFLDEHDIPAEARSRRLRLDPQRTIDAPVWLFSAEELTFDLTVLPLDVLRQAPLSGIDEKPMKRASLAQLGAMLAEDEIAAYEAGG
jgi:hypothetical protein